MRGTWVLAVLGVWLAGSLAHGEAVVLQANKTATPQEVRLSWTGGVPAYTVYRGALAATLVQPGNVVGTTSASEWLDSPPGSIAFFLVASPCTAGPPAVCCLNDAGCLSSEFCDPSSSACAPKKGAGALCSAPNQCTAGFCVDGVCCSSSCTGTCQKCDLEGTVGSCTNVPAGTDPNAECPGLSCAGYYYGFVGDTCFARASVSASASSCNGTGACKTQAQECSASSQGSATVTCNPQCQDPTPGTCTGTTAGSCTNVNPGNQTCGVGACQRSVPQCVNGAPNTCTPGAPQPEQCNDIDDNCDGIVDNNSQFIDALEGNNSCAAPRMLQSVSEGQTLTLSTATLYPSGDVDVYQIPALESGSHCECCDGGFCFDEDFRLSVTLTVPAGAGSYELCLPTGTTCTGTFGNCTTVPAGTSGSVNAVLHGSCSGDDDTTYFIRVRGIAAPAFECRPYTLQYSNVQGCFP